MRTAARIWGAVLVTVVLGACGPASGTPPAATPSGQRSPTPVVSPAASPVPGGTPSGRPAACWPLRGGTSFPGGTPRPAIADVRVGRHPGYDRLVIEFAGPGVPPYEMRPNPAPPGGGTQFTLSPSGRAVTVQGGFGAQLRFDDVAWLDDRYAHGRDVVAGFPVLKEVRVIEEYEGVVVLGVGLSGNVCPVVTLLNGPPRLVLDFPTG